MFDAAIRVRVGRCRLPVGVQGETVAATEQAKEVVEGVVLHHEDNDVVDAGQQVGASGQPGLRP